MALTAPPPPFVGYQPNGPGYNFLRPDGSSAFFYGDYANQLKDNIDRTKPPDNRLAMGGSTTPGIASLPPSVTAPDPGLAQQIQSKQAEDFRQALMSKTAPQSHDTTPTEYAGAPPQAPPQAPPPAPAAAGAPGAASGSGGQGNATARAGLVMPPTGRVPVMSGAPSPGAAGGGPDQGYIPRRVVYSRGTNPAHDAASAVPVPVQQSMIREGGVADPAERAKVIENYDAQVEAQKKLAEVQSSGYQMQVQQQRAEAAEQARRQQEAEDEIVRQQARKKVLNDEYNRRMNIAQADYDQSNKKEVDQYRIFRGNVGGQIAAGIGIMLGSVGQAMTGGARNQALDQINRQMDNDIEGQREAIQRGTVKASNDLLRIREQYGLDTDDAASILKFNYAKRAEAEAQKKAALIGTQQAQMAFAQVQPAFQKWQAEAAEQLRVNLDGKTRVGTESRMVVPRAGGPHMETDAEYNKRLKGEAENEANKYRITHGGSAPPKGSNGPGKLSARLAMTEAINESGSEDIVQLTKADPGGLLSEKIPTALRSQERLKYEAAVNAAAPKILAANGENQTEAALASVKEQLLSPYPSVRKAAQQKYLGANRVVHSALERQRGGVQTSGGSSDESEDQ